MENAGRAVACLVAARFADRVRQGVLVAVGPGNNGGDGWVAARALHRAGAPVWVASCGSAAPGSLAHAVAERARADGVREVAGDGPWPTVALVIDAILGTGASGPLRGPAAPLVDRLADLALPVVAVDGPTGLDLLNGVQHGPLSAQLTVTFGGYRRGHLLARDEVGDVVVVDIGFPPPDPAWPTLYTRGQARAALPRFRANIHKGNRGRVVVVGGQAGMTGAARLAARAAFAAGAGYVHLVSPEDSVATLATAEPDLQTCVQEFDAPIGPRAAEVIRRADALVVGPGLGLADERRDLVLDLLGRVRAAVVDADALAALRGEPAAMAEAARDRRVVLTPHLGEFRGLFPDLASDAAVDPWGAATVAAERMEAVVLLKGVPTVVARAGVPAVTVAAGNPGLATGGTGDTLSGLIATFLAQDMDPVAAAALGAYALGHAADLAAARKSTRAMRPMDVVDALPDLWRGWEVAGRALDVARPPVLHELERPRHL
jgi:hydroxyethylthiazole kinase-like uncharacterized protein yjeF